MDPFFSGESLEQFDLLDMTARLSFRSQSSISFLLGSVLPDVFRAHGRIEVHYPCEGHSTARLRFWLPAQYLDEQTMLKIINSVLSVLRISEDNTHEALFFETGYRRFHIVNGIIVSGAKEFIHLE